MDQSTHDVRRTSWFNIITELEGTLKNRFPQERLKEPQTSIKPLVEEYFAWIKDIFRQGLVLPKSETAKGFTYSINQEEYLKVFLTDGEVPIDDSASERALRNFTIDRKNWMQSILSVEPRQVQPFTALQKTARTKSRITIEYNCCQVEGLQKNTRPFSEQERVFGSGD